MSGLWQSEVKYSDLNDLKVVLDKVSTIANMFKDDRRAIWISVPIHRLINELLLVFSCTIVNGAPKGEKDFINKDTRVSLNAIVQTLVSINSSTTSSLIVVELATLLGSM